MYKNFNLTDKERKQILESHMSHGYRQPLNETAGKSLDINEAGRNPVKMVINSILRKNGIKKVESSTTSVRGFSRTSGSGYEYNYGGSLSLINIEPEVVKDLADQMKSAGVEIYTVYSNGIDFNHRELREPNLGEPLNELGSREIDLVRGIPDFKTKTGLPVGDYVSRRNASRQFQQDFQRDFADPNDEYVPYWEKDKPLPSDGPEMDTELKTSARQADRELGAKKIELSNEKSREERIRLRRRIASLVSHKEEFGGDEELDRVIEKLRSQAREIDDNKF
jgi:hypothetical protein